MAGKKISPSTNATVDSFIKASKHPLKKEMQILREIILGADKGITEQIKWNAPSFCFEGDDRITFNLHKKEFILIIFHRGAKAKPAHDRANLFEDKTGLLSWVATDRATMKIANSGEALKSKNNLVKLVRQWIEATRSRGAPAL